MTVLSLRTLKLAARARARVVVEVVNSDNCELLRGERNVEFVVSPDIVSMLLTQISQQVMLKGIYEDLLSAGGTEIYLRSADRYVKPDEVCHFEDLAASASARRELAIGVKLAAESGQPERNFGVHLNPARGAGLKLGRDDRVIVIGSRMSGHD